MSATCREDDDGYLCGVVNGDDKNDNKSEGILKKNEDLKRIMGELKKENKIFRENKKKLSKENDDLLRENKDLKMVNT